MIEHLLAAIDNIVNGEMNLPTGGRTMSLIKCYIELYGEDYYPTIAESLLAENKMIVK
jgi:hypothetical protein